VIREVTHDENYISIKMAEKDYKMPESDKKAIKDKRPPKPKKQT
jgi:hypothetical protein